MSSGDFCEVSEDRDETKGPFTAVGLVSVSAPGVEGNWTSFQSPFKKRDGPWMMESPHRPATDRPPPPSPPPL